MPSSATRFGANGCWGKFFHPGFPFWALTCRALEFGVDVSYFIVSPATADEVERESPDMIELTRLNGHSLFVNCDQIKWAEAAPDTMLTLMSGEKVVVRESCAEVVDRIIGYRARLLRAVAETEPLGPQLLALGSRNLAGHIAEAVVEGEASLEIPHEEKRTE
jgi:flagellar protein FlbD